MGEAFGLRLPGTALVALPIAFQLKNYQSGENPPNSKKSFDLLSDRLNSTFICTAFS